MLFLHKLQKNNPGGLKGAIPLSPWSPKGHVNAFGGKCCGWKTWQILRYYYTCTTSWITSKFQELTPKQHVSIPKTDRQACWPEVSGRSKRTSFSDLGSYLRDLASPKSSPKNDRLSTDLATNFAAPSLSFVCRFWGLFFVVWGGLSARSQHGKGPPWPETCRDLRTILNHCSTTPKQQETNKNCNRVPMKKPCRAKLPFRTKFDISAIGHTTTRPRCLNDAIMSNATQCTSGIIRCQLI